MKNKNIIYLLIVILALASYRCEPDYINQVSPDKLNSDNFFRNETDATAAVFDAYTRMTYYGWRFGEYYLAPVVYRGEDVELLPGAAAWSYLADIGNFNYNDNSEVPSTYWGRLYVGLNAANFAIDGISGMTADQIDETQKNNILGEAYFIRAVTHLTLLCYFEQIILIDSYTTSVEDLERPLSSREEAWQSIEDDLTLAATLLPSAWDEANLGRATIGAAYGFLGKTHLFQEEYTDAHTAFTQMPDIYDLVTDYEGLFTGNENSEESVFELQFVSGVQGSLEFRACLAISYATEDLGGWNMFRPSDKLITEFMNEAAVGGGHDIRLTGSIVWNDPASTFLGSSMQTTIPSYKKYISSAASMDDDGAGENFYLMRFADVLLMDAESLNEDGSTAAAITLLNEVRDRAGLDNTFTGSQAQVRAEIRRQRFLELAGEGHRFYDLVRWGIATTTLHNSGVAGADNYVEEDHAYFKVPQSEKENNSLVD